MSATPFITLSSDKQTRTFNGKEVQTMYPAAYIQDQVNKKSSQLKEIATESGLIDHADAIFYMTYLHDTIHNSIEALENTRAYKGEQGHVLAPLKNIEFCQLKSIYDKVENAKSAKQLFDSLMHVKEFIHTLALFIHNHQNKNA
ncbi:hypothetical protein DZF79_15715 [Vibrio parahaemolyticus]|nr:hypothetical protein [Vibrio parahaemolyticus]